MFEVISATIELIYKVSEDLYTKYLRKVRIKSRGSILAILGDKKPLKTTQKTALSTVANLFELSFWKNECDMKLYLFLFLDYI